MVIPTTTPSRIDLLAPAGRLLIALLFIPAGYGKLTAAEATSQYMASGGLPAWPTLAVLVGLFEIAAGLALLVGFMQRWSALALAVFTLLATVLFHNFWAAPPEQQFVQQLMFFKNLAAVGGLLFIASIGSSPWSVDRMGQPEEAWPLVARR